MLISIAVPTNRGILPQTMQCLLELIDYSKNKYDLNIIVAEEGFTVAENRNYIAVQAINLKSDYLLLIDDDMTFPPDTLEKLLANDKDICGVAYHSRGSVAMIKCVGEIMSIAKVEVSERKYINLE